MRIITLCHSFHFAAGDRLIGLQSVSGTANVKVYLIYHFQRKTPASAGGKTNAPGGVLNVVFTQRRYYF
jgi:hypothetical protein